MYRAYLGPAPYAFRPTCLKLEDIHDGLEERARWLETDSRRWLTERQDGLKKDKTTCLDQRGDVSLKEDEMA